MSNTHLQVVSHNCKFGQWRFNPDDGLLTSAEKRSRLQPRIAKLLAIFLANHQQVISRDDLIETLWQGKVVNEDALSRCIAELRAALGDNTAQPIYIETVPKRGYRFLKAPHATTSFSKYNFSIATVAVLLIVIGVSTLITQRTSTQIDQLAQLQTMIVSAERLTTDVAMEYVPSISPSGNLIAYTSNEGENSSVRISSISGEVLYEVKVPNRNLYSPVVNTNDSEVLVVALGNDNCEILSVTLPTLEQSSITSCASPSASPIVDLSDDNNLITYVDSDKNSAVSIWLYDRKTKQKTQLTAPEVRNSFDTNPRFNTDNTAIAFTRGTHSTRDIFLVRIDKPLTEQRLSDNRNYITGIDWLNDNKTIIHDSNERGDRNLWLFDSLTGESTLLGARNAQLPTISADNLQLAFLDVNYNANLCRVEIN